MTDTVERILLRLPKCHMFKIPPRQSAEGYTTAGWEQHIMWSGPLRVVAIGNDARLEFLDDKGTAFAIAPITDPLKWETSVEPVLDSSRYFVTRIIDPSGTRKVNVGIGFDDRAAAFSFKATLSDHAEWVENEKNPKKISFVEDGPALDFGLKAGEKLTFNFSNLIASPVNL